MDNSLSLPNGYSVGPLISQDPLYDIYEGSQKGADVIIKVYPLRKRKCKNAYQQETSNLKKLKAQSNGKTSNVIEMKDNFIVGNKGFVILPMEEHNLEEIIEELEPKAKYKIFYDICCALDECFNAKIAHLDLQLKNIVVIGNIAKLTNFSSSLRWSTLKSTSMKNCGIVPFKAPEITNPCGYTPYLADYWSLGVILHALLSDRIPVIQGESIYIDDSIPQTARNLVDSLVQLEPQLRPPVSYVLKHELFTEEEVFTNLRENYRATKKRGKRRGITRRLQRVMSANLGKMKKGSNASPSGSKSKKEKK